MQFIASFIVPKEAFHVFKQRTYLSEDLPRVCTSNEDIKGVGLNPNDKKHVGKYSFGMKQRLGLAQAIMEDPELLILDEPMNGLDKDGVKDMRQYLLDLKAQGKTILIASHSADDIDVLS